VKKGISEVFSFVAAFIMLVILFFAANLYGGGKLDLEYNVEGVTRFQSCDITLIALLQTKYIGEDYDYSEVIARGEVKNEIIIENSKEYIDLIYGEGNTSLHITPICVSSCADKGKCCSQFIPTIEGTCMEVKINVLEEQ
jgi:hypothetical protein